MSLVIHSHSFAHQGAFGQPYYVPGFILDTKDSKKAAAAVRASEATGVASLISGQLETTWKFRMDLQEDAG